MRWVRARRTLFPQLACSLHRADPIASPPLPCPCEAKSRPSGISCVQWPSSFRGAVSRSSAGMRVERHQVRHAANADRRARCNWITISCADGLFNHRLKNTREATCAHGAQREKETQHTSLQGFCNRVLLFLPCFCAIPTCFGRCAPGLDMEP